jgi:hypothetical protein
MDLRLFPFLAGLGCAHAPSLKYLSAPIGAKEAFAFSLAK